MEPIRFDGASVDRGVLSRLKRLDKYLRVTFSPYALDTFTGRPIILNGVVDTSDITAVPQYGPVVDPAHYLWRKDRHSSHHFFVQSYPLGLCGGFGHRQVLSLESDLARFYSPDEAWRIVKAASDREAARRENSHRAHLQDKAAANASFGIKALRGEVNWKRDARTFSYGGVGSRLSGAERSVSRDNRELGIEG